MTSKADYLKKYLSTDDLVEGKKKKRIKKRANLAIHDDDVDWRSLVPKNKLGSEDEGDPDEAPLVAEFKDESVQKNPKWQPLAEDEDMDLSPPRRRQFDSPDLSPPRGQNRKRHDPRDDDLSPPRKQTKSSRTSRNMSPDLRITSRNSRRSRVRHDSPDETLMEHPLDSAVIGGRRRQRHDSGDISPPRRTRHDSGDISPPRRTRRDSGDISPPRKTRRDSGDISPPRRTRRDSGDISPPRRKRHDSGDISPPRRTVQDSEDLSPPRVGANFSTVRRSRPSTDISKSKDRMTSGARAGLQNAQALKEENALVRKKQEDYFKSLDPSVSGKHAETVYRDKQGRKVDPKLEKLRKKEKEKEMEEENEKFMTWGKGAAQSKSHQDKLQEDIYEMSKPLARYADDEDLERMLKERERAGDPMLAFIQKSKAGKANKKSNQKVKPTYKGSFPPNRFGLRPGYRWDGVNRSNGFEKSRFARESNKKATADEAYKWSVEDM